MSRSSVPGNNSGERNILPIGYRWKDDTLWEVLSSRGGRLGLSGHARTRNDVESSPRAWRPRFNVRVNRDIAFDTPYHPNTSTFSGVSPQARAEAAAVTGKTDEAIATLKDAVRFEQQHPVDYPNVLTPPSAELLGTLLLKQNRPSEAAHAFQTALELAPNTLHSVEGQKVTANDLHAKR